MISFFNGKEIFGILKALPQVPVAQWIERSPPKRQVARSIRAEDVLSTVLT